jgi:hypothetical protein
MLDTHDAQADVKGMIGPGRSAGTHTAVHAAAGAQGRQRRRGRHPTRRLALCVRVPPPARHASPSSLCVVVVVDSHTHTHTHSLSLSLSLSLFSLSLSLFSLMWTGRCRASFPRRYPTTALQFRLMRFPGLTVAAAQELQRALAVQACSSGCLLSLSLSLSLSLPMCVC